MLRGDWSRGSSDEPSRRNGQIEMTIGAGKYDGLCGLVRRKAKALAAVVIVLDGTKGSGFSVQVLEGAHIGVIEGLPELLRQMADEIERDNLSRRKAAQA